MKYQQPRKIQLEFTCNIDHCIYGDRKCIAADLVHGDIHICECLTAKATIATPAKTPMQQAEEAYAKLRTHQAQEAINKLEATQ